LFHVRYSFLTHPLTPSLLERRGNDINMLTLLISSLPASNLRERRGDNFRFSVLIVKETIMQYRKIKQIARRLRKNQTPAEKLLWCHLRERKLKGKRFIRQHPIIYDSNRNEYFFFVADFYCKEENLVIELDGPVHDKLKERDKRRDLILSNKNLKVLRIKNEELVNMDEVLKKITEVFGSVPPPSSEGGGQGVGG
jgi:very-short-patch-repair endonuclease